MKHVIGMMQLLRHTANEFGKTIVLVLYDVNFASCYSDHIIVMKNVQIARQCSPAEIIQSDVMRSIYDIDIAVYTIGDQRIAVYYNSVTSSSGEAFLLAEQGNSQMTSSKIHTKIKVSLVISAHTI